MKRTRIPSRLAMLSRAARVAAVIAASSLPVAGQDLSRSIEIHGFGTVGYGETDVNNYQFGDSDGSYSNSELAFNVAAQWKQLLVATQVEWRTSDRFEGNNAEIDFAFAEWKFSDAVRLRMGQVKHPFGLYAEILDVGTLRPFLLLPVGVYGPTGAVAERYTGAGLTGHRLIGADWELRYDVYGGELVLDAAHPWEALEKIGFREDEQLRITDMIGGRLVLASPLQGLSFGVSAYAGTGSPEREFEEGEGEAGEAGELSAVALRISGGGGEEAAPSDQMTYGAQIEYLDDDWLVRSELVRHEFDTRHDIDAFYLEAAYRFNSHWQLAARYDWADVELAKLKPAMEIAKKAPSLLEHEDVGLSLNYWFRHNLVIKLAYHQVEGNFFARPLRNEVREAVQKGALDPDTELLQIGLNFSF